MSTVTIINREKQNRSIVLEHQEVCVRHGRCLCTKGKPKTVHLPAESTVKNVCDSILLSSDLQQGKAAGIFMVLPTPKRVEQGVAPQKGKGEPKGKGRSHRKKTESK